MRPAAGVAGLGFGLALCAGSFDAEPLWAPGLGLLVLALVVSVWVERAARGATIVRTLGARRVEEGEGLDIVLEARIGGGAALPAPPALVRDPLAPEGLPLGDGHVRLRARFARRGRRTLAPPVLELRDPLGLVRREVVGAESDEVLVLPAIEPVRALSGGTGDAGGFLAGLGLVAAMEVDGLRPYREGTPGTRIHWSSLARGAGLMERRLRPEADERPLLVLDGRVADSPDAPEALDAAVRAAASLTRALARHGGLAVLLPGDRRPADIAGEGAAWASVHARLALAEPGSGPPAAAAGAPHTGPVVFVTARRLERFPSAWAAVARGTRVLVMPAAARGRTAAFSVAGCAGYDVTPLGPGSNPARRAR